MFTRTLITNTLMVLTSGAIMSSANSGPPGVELVRFTIGGGGVIAGTGGDFELSGTIGQPDATTVRGGLYELSGGYWFSTPPGDCNEDGIADLYDVASFEACMTGPVGPPPVDPCRCFDVDRSGSVDLADFAAVQAVFSTSGASR
ncbi:MAG: hypothetical protein HY763_13565 [Planctomycetes bacterium]|nr:hypothetical protein [Planctomycetota bacterium]